MSWLLAIVLGARVGSPPASPEGPTPAPVPVKSTPPRGLEFDPEAAPPVDTTPADLGLIRQEGGGYLYVDPAQRFTAQFQPDGTVQFADRWKRPSAERPQRGHCCALPAEGFSAINPLAGMQMKGPMEWLMAIQGADPNAIAKNAILDQTRDLRIRLAVAHNLALLEARLHELAPELLAIWSDPALADHRRREILFERWDDCDERFNVQPGDVPAEAVGEIDAARVQTAERARRKIEAFIRRHAPAGTRRAFTRPEMDAFNRRRVSRQEFSPYTRRAR